MEQKAKFSYIILLLTWCLFISAQTNLTAEDILNKSIAFCGGARNLSKIKSSNLIYDLTKPDGSQTSLLIKRKVGQEYLKSTLSDKHVPTSVYYNGFTAISVRGETKTVVRDARAIDEIKLQTYNQPQYGYKMLSYSLKRHDDQKFNHFDCYVVSATSKNGYITLNYFDKTNFRLIMMIYPKGNKSVYSGYDFRDSVLYNTKMINVEENSEQIKVALKKLDNNIHINPLWFSIDTSRSTSVPGFIKQGTSVSVDSTLVKRTSAIQTEKKGNFNYTLYLKWVNNYAYVMVDSNSISAQTSTGAVDKILVKIVSWNRDEYVCHYYSNGISGSQEYKRKK